jgi:hypothetical protein
MSQQSSAGKPASKGCIDTLSSLGGYIAFLALVFVILSANFRGCSSVKPEQYNRITPGMSLKDVEAILGEGQPLALEDVRLADGDGVPVLSARATKARAWSGAGPNGALLVILFQDDKVVAKLSKGL